jgi:hypothetical protein
MKTFILSLALFAATGSAVAQDSKWFKGEKTVSCGPFREIVAALSGDRWKETPIWMGEVDGDTKSRITLMVNESTGGWTVLEYQGETACILGMGTKGRAVDVRPKI